MHTKIWQDDWFAGLSRGAKLLFLYLITNQEIGMTGVYELPDRVMMFNVGLNQSELEQAKKELSGKVAFYNGWVFVRNSERYNSFRGEKNELAKEREYRGIPLEIKKALVEGKADRVSIEYGYPTDTSIINNHNHNQYKRGIVKGESAVPYSDIDSLGEVEFEEIAKRYNCPVAFVRSEYEDMVYWKESKPNNPKLRGRNWKMTLMAWVKRDSLKIKQNYAKQTSDIAL